MALASLLLATVLVAQPPVKLTHTYVKDQKVTYTVSMKDDTQGIEIGGDITFACKDDKGTHGVASPAVKVMKDGSEIANNELTLDKLVLDPKGIAANYEFNDSDVALIIATICGYLPDKEIEQGTLFDIKEKRENYNLEGNGKLVEITEKDGVKLATVEYTIDVAPSTESPGKLKAKSTFDIATGQLVSSLGTVEIDARTATISVKRK